MTALNRIEGIGDAYGERLHTANIDSIEDLLETCASKAGRKKVAKDTNISETLILNWVNRADLARVNGIGTQYADLLEEAGVDTVPELAHRNPENLLAKMAEINEAKNLVRKLPTLGNVQDWVNQAKNLPKVITH